MSVSLTLQERLKQKYQEENEIIQNLTKQGLKDIQRSLISTLQEGQSTIRKDMHQAFEGELKEVKSLMKEYQETKKNFLLRVLRNWILFPALSAITVLTGLFLGGWGVSTYQESRITENWEKINAQKETLTELEKRTGGVNIVQNEKGLFIVLPKGVMTVDNWKIGEQKAIQVVR
ncbi:hypothetical protein [Xenorhabdus bovienii]|uniref:hypothetical protein n=2 Tax=Xenorhabdus bovienii TaxID=40576 RepID=UPI0023B2F105|nr:hypothetical protein [Xenorhabdus bovienii]MDE9590337.1 hypothetical protein [Xenorhabdus bovienii]